MAVRKKSAKAAVNTASRVYKPEWRVIVDMLAQVDVVLLHRITKRMIYFLFQQNVKEIADLMKELESPFDGNDYSSKLYDNAPNPKKAVTSMKAFVEKVFKVAGDTIIDEEITAQIHKWLARERSQFLIIAAENSNISLVDITDSVNRFVNIPKSEIFMSEDELINIRANLIRRFLSNDLNYLKIAKQYIRVVDFHRLLQSIVGCAQGTGKLGGKSSGIILGYNVIEKLRQQIPELANVVVPRSWYITSDAIMDFIHYNALEEVTSLKYMHPEEIRAGYPYLLQLFKHSFFTAEIIFQLRSVLDEVGEKPIIVRSSSLLEDSFGSSFSGKYKSLFLANRGSREERLTALLDAIAEIYASVFSPEPIAYRRERGLLDFNEEMGILIQEVVGRQVGKYFLPLFSGVAFSNNEFRWSPRIEKKDGVIRMVMGLGTRAVDRVGDDYPFLCSPGKPGLRVNINEEDIMRYSQNKIDVLNLESNQFETIEAREFLREYGNSIEGLERIVSINSDHTLSVPMGAFLIAGDADIVITFQGLVQNTAFLKKMKTLLKVLEEAFASPVDVEFAVDGDKLYFLQCRPQSSSDLLERGSIPENVPDDRIVFTADRYVTPGVLKNVEYIVYVDAQAYDQLAKLEDMKKVAQAVSRLNQLLPRKRFILVGPGRWGSRGDIKLGVPVTYIDINNTAMLIEVALKKDGYVPEVSFGTHFFQDLVESRIQYLPLYPDQKNNVFNRAFLNESTNSLAVLAPDFASLQEVVKVIRIADIFPGETLTVIMDDEADQAMAFIES